MQWARLPIYPLLLGTFPVAAYYTQNRLELEWPELIRPLAVAGIATMAVYACFYLLVRKRDLAMLLSLLFLLWVYLYSHFFRLTAFWFGPDVRHSQVLLPWSILGVLSLAAALYLLRRSERLTAFTRFMNLFAVVLWVLVLIAGVVSEGRARTAAAETGHIESPASLDWATPDNLSQARARKQRPDIYWIILDGYARGDILQTRFNYDNNGFLDQLRHCGFFVADQSHSNYCYTHLSLSATLNGEYLQDLVPADVGMKAPQEHSLRFMYFVDVLNAYYIRTNRTRQFLEDLGYQWQTTETGYAVTRPQGVAMSEVVVGTMTQFERLLLRTTVFEPAISNSPLPAIWELVAKYDIVKYELEKLTRLPDLSGPIFAQYHIMCPHTPFCFDAQGNGIAPHPLYGSSSATEELRAMPGYDEYYRQHYPQNVAGLNIHAIQAIRSLIEQTQGKAVIIVQADHGSNMGLDVFNVSQTDIPERFGILNAIYLPPQYSRQELDPSMSSVNTFRVILSTVFGADLPKLPDRAWYSSGDLDFTEVTSIVRQQDHTP